MTNLTSQTPAEIDAKLSELYAQEHKARGTHDRIQESLTSARIAKATGKGYAYTPYDEDDAQTAYAALKAVIEQELPLEAEYERRPWQRYWHVTNVSGHIHRTRACSSCFPDTQYAWRTDLSGLTDTEVVEREAYNACSVCMPIAPAEQKAARVKYNKAQADARKAERQAVKDAKAEKALVRARKHVDKVLNALRQMTGEINGEIFEVMQVFARDYSVHGHDGKKSAYSATSNLPTTVGNTIYYLAERNSDTTRRSMHKPNEAVMTALTEKEMI